jgi:hypothetical protein
MQWLDAIVNLRCGRAGTALPASNTLREIVQILGEEDNVWGSCSERTG